MQYTTSLLCEWPWNVSSYCTVGRIKGDGGIVKTKTTQSLQHLGQRQGILQPRTNHEFGSPPYPQFLSVVSVTCSQPQSEDIK